MFVTKSGNCGEMFLTYLLLVAVLMFSCGNSQEEYRGVTFTRLGGRHSGDEWTVLYSGEMYSAKFPHESSSFYLQWYFYTPNGFGGGRTHGDVNFRVLDDPPHCKYSSNYKTNATCAIEGDYVITNFSVSGIEESMDKAILLLNFQNTTQLGNKTISVSVMTRLDGNAEGSVWPVDYVGDMFSANFFHSSVLGSRFYWVLKHSNGTELGRAELEVDTVAETCSKLSPTSGYTDCTCELDGSHVTTKFVANQLRVAANGSLLVLEYPSGEGIANRTIVLSATATTTTTTTTTTTSAATTEDAGATTTTPSGGSTQNSTVGEDGVELQQDSAANITPPTITILSTFVCFLFVKYLQLF